MPCYHPQLVYRSKDGPNPETGKWPIVFNPRDGFNDLTLQVPCGQCIGCRLERSRQWAIRCIHEASLHEHNSFITLTYDQANLPKDGSLVKGHFQKFMKRLRRRYADRTVRYYMCGEYGEELGRPHYHACLFGLDWPDQVLLSAKNECKLYTSNELSTLWPFGYAVIGEVTFESAAYVARYILKKVTGDPAADHYRHRVPEYTTMSRRPGIGSDWFDRFQGDVYPWDEVVIRDGVRCRPPRFYDKQLETTDPKAYKAIKARRAKAADNPDNSLRRLIVREQVKLAKMQQLKRGYEINDNGSL